jgi:hypothetical protein
MSLASSLQKVANKAISKFGGDITLQFVTTAAYDPATGTASESTTTATIKGVLENVSAREVSDLVRSDDKKLTIAASSISSTPGPDDKIVIGGVTHQVIRMETIEQGNTAIVYVFFLRS